MTGTDPVFRFDGSQVRVWVDDCVVAPAGRSTATLVMVDNPRDLVWHGRSNLYSRIGVFQTCSGRDDRQEPIVDFSRWIETPTDRRESGSKMVAASIWDAADPSVALAAETDNPTRVFLLNQAVAQGSDAGATPGALRVDPQKPTNIATRSRDAGDEAQPASSRRTESASLDRKRSEPSGASAEATQTPAPMPLTTTTNPVLGPFEDDAADLATMPPMPPMPSPSQTAPTAAEGPSSGNEIASSSAGQPRAGRRRPVDPRGDRSVAARPRSPARAHGPGNRPNQRSIARDASSARKPGGVIRIAAGAVLELPATVIDGTGRFQTPGRARRQAAPAPFPAGAVRSTFAGGLDRHGRPPRGVSPS